MVEQSGPDLLRLICWIPKQVKLNLIYEKNMFCKEKDS